MQPTVDNIYSTNGQSVPDLDNIIALSKYFNVTTDYILKGLEETSNTHENNSKQITSQILYIASTFFLVIGLLCAFGGWYEEQSAEAIGGSMIIQVVGIAGYFIGTVISSSKSPFVINYLNIIIALLMPISFCVDFALNRKLDLYPTDIFNGFVFTLIYIIVMLSTYFILKRVQD